MAACALAQTPALSDAEHALPATKTGSYAVLPFSQFAPNTKPVLNKDGSPHMAWYQAEIGYLETKETPPKGSSIISVPAIPAHTLSGIKLAKFTPMLGSRYVYSDFQWVEYNPVGKKLDTPIPYGTVFYFVPTREKDGRVDIEIYFYQTQNLRWEDGVSLKVDAEGDVVDDGNYVARPDLRHLQEKVTVKLGHWTFFLMSMRLEKGAASGGLKNDDVVYGYLIMRLRPVAMMHGESQ